MTSDSIKYNNILVSEPFLEDPSFYRTVVQLVEHNDKGTVGFVLNQPSGFQLCDLLDDCDLEIPVYIGGPVQQDTLHIIHRITDIPEAVHLVGNACWSGRFDLIRIMLDEQLAKVSDVRFFLGYSGWDKGQLRNELNQKSWILAEGKENYIFDADANLWKHILQDLNNGQYQYLANAPKDIQLN